MALCKIVKTKAYFKRFQVKYKRRRQGKTDYRQRLRLTIQDKNKYATPKYRFAVRFTNKDICCQVIHATIKGDITMTSAYSHELPSYGLKVGLTNYAAGYCTGLLCARRALAVLKLDKAYEGLKEASGEDYNVEENEDGPRPFSCLLDVGLKRTSTGSKVFSCMKGALDGGLDIPHNEKRYVGYSAENKSLDEDVLADHLFGGHVGEYMELLQEGDDEEGVEANPEQFQKLFSQYIKNGLTNSEDLKAMYTDVHAAIRANPAHVKKAKKKPAKAMKYQAVKLTYEEKKAKVQAKLVALE